MPGATATSSFLLLLDRNALGLNPGFVAALPARSQGFDPAAR